LVPRLVSDLEHAPYFAEISILHQLSLLPAEPVTSTAARVPLPPCAWYILGIEATVLALMLFICNRLLRHPHPARQA
jgi:disulfide bond formation protein DsbB